jgi:hypothetical protein
MQSLDQIAQYLWCAQPLLQAVVAIVLWRRGLRKKFPVFFAYILAQIAIFGVTFPLRSTENYEWFFYVYWAGAAVSALLGFRVIHEVFLDVFRPYDTLKDLGTVLFKWAAVVMLLVAVVVAFSSSNSGEQWGIWERFLIQAVTSLQRSVRLVQCGLILFLLLFSSFLGISRRQQSFGIALGFGLFASAELILIVLNAGSYLSVGRASLINLAAYDAAIAIWLVYVLAPSLARDAAANHLQTQRWERSLADLHTPAAQGPLPADALIPMFEGMVERAFSRGSTVGNTDSDKSAAAAKAGSNTAS